MRARHGACLCLVLVLWATVVEVEASPGPFFNPGSFFINAQAPVNRMLGPPQPPPAYVPPLYPQPQPPVYPPPQPSGIRGSSLMIDHLGQAMNGLKGLIGVKPSSGYNPGFESNRMSANGQYTHSWYPSILGGPPKTRGGYPHY